jgi:hypothetical protein
LTSAADARVTLVLLQQVHVLFLDIGLGLEGARAEAACHDVLNLLIQLVRLLSRVGEDARPLRPGAVEDEADIVTCVRCRDSSRHLE